MNNDYIQLKENSHKNINTVAKQIGFGGKIEKMSQEGQPPPPPSVLSRICSESLITIGVVLGILLIWIAQLVGIFGSGGDIHKIVFVLLGLGMAFLGTTLISGGILNRNIDKFVRFGMVFIGGFATFAMLAITLIAS